MALGVTPAGTSSRPPKVPRPTVPKIRRPAPQSLAGSTFTQIVTKGPGKVAMPKGRVAEYDAQGNFNGFRDDILAKGVSLGQNTVLKYDAQGRPSFVKPEASVVPGLAKPPAGQPPQAGPTAPDPRDSAYWRGLDGLRRDRDASMADLQRQDEYARVDLEDRIRQLAEQRAKQQDSARLGRNKQGLFYSSVLSNDLAGAENVERDQGEASRDAARRAAADREAQRGELDRGLGRGEADLFEAGVGRQLDRDLQASPPPVPVQDGPADPVTAFVQEKTTNKGRPFRTYTKGGYVWHRWPDGREVAVRRAGK